MQKNWRNQDSKNLPRFEAIRAILNEKILQEKNRLQADEEEPNAIDLFCLGMGFKTIMHTSDDDASFQKEHHMVGPRVQTWNVHHLVCDILALIELLPTQAVLNEFQQQLNQKWQHHAKSILEQAVIVDDVYAELKEYIRMVLSLTATKRLHQRLRYKLSQIQPPNWFARYLRDFVEQQKQKIAAISTNAAQQYADEVVQRTVKDFTSHKDLYVEIIRKHLTTFAMQYTASTLKGLTLGFSIAELVDNLDEEKATAIASKIQTDIEKEVKKKIALSVEYHIQRLLSAKRSIAATIDKKQVRYMTERVIKKYGWDIIQPLVERTVHTVFVEHFDEQVRQNLPYWIQLASTREIIRPLQQLSFVLPSIDTEHATVDKIMFGGTPFAQSLDKAAIRFIDERYREKKKVLIIISDGEFLQSSSINVTASLLKKRGVTIISCLIAKQDLLSGFVSSSPSHWFDGAKQMLEVASSFSEKDPSMGWGRIQHQLANEKLCIQINHSSLLEDVFDTVFNHEDGEDIL